MPPVRQTPEAVRRILMDPESYTSTLTVLLADIYGSEYLTWEPATLLLELQSDFKAVLPQIVFDRIMVGVQLLTSNAFYKSCPDFVEQCSVIAGYPAGFDILPDSVSCAWGITEALLLSPPDDDDDNPFTDEILAYIGIILDREGIADPPDVLKIAIMPESSDELFSDDADMYAAVKSVDAAKTAEITSLLQRSLRQLVQQLADLPLVNGDTTAIANRISKS